MTKELRQASIRAIKTPFKFFIGSFLIFLGFLIAFDVLAYDEWYIDFEDYNLGQLHGQYDWTGYTGFEVKAGKWVGGTSASAVRVIDKPISAFELDEMTGKWELSYKAQYYHTNSDSRFYLRGNTTKYLMADIVRDGTEDAQVYASFTRYDANTEVFLGTTTTVVFTYYGIPDYTWIDFKWEIDFNDRWIRLFSKLSEDEDWSEFTMAGQKFWFSATTDRTTNLIFNSVRVELASGFTMYGTDDLKFAFIIPPCSQQNCDSCKYWFDCESVGCCWYYNPLLFYPFTNYCGTCAYYECSYETCGSCSNQEDCEGAGCYWTGEYCSWIVSQCGSGLACQFCDVQETCEEKGCYWSSSNQNCWFQAPTLPSSWEDYYAEHGGYEESAVFVNNLANNAEKMFSDISSLFEGFIISFNTSEALARGTALGQVIPQSRGYLKVFDSFFGHIPIGETFIFILIFMLAIGVFRIARHLIQLVKP